jgi:hypothetical protein
MTVATQGRNRLGAWYERTGYPGLVLAALVFALYCPSLFGGFILDDHRCLRLLGEYHRGERQSLDVYRFLFGGPSNREARQEGWYPWWLSDDVRYRHLRPVSERVLYGEYLLFGDRAIGFRLVGIALYALGAWLVFGLFRMIGGDEVLARWGALLFAVAACHTVPVVFVSNHCDLIALVTGVGAILAVGCFIRDGGAGKLLAGAVLFAVGLLAKEAVLAMAVLPACLWLVFRERRGAGRRTMAALALLGVCGVAWLVYYASSGSGSNALPMLDPIHAPRQYLAALPGRAIVLLSSWVMPFNPFLFFLHHDWGRWLYAYGAAGACCLLLLARMFWRHHRAQRGVSAMALWVLPFLPLLVCTPPDDRVMMLPSIGLAFLGAAWMTRPRAGSNKAATGREQGTDRTAGPRSHPDVPLDGPDRLIGASAAKLRRLPFFVFVVMQIASVLAATGLVQFMEDEAQRHEKLMLDGFGRPVKPGDHLFYLNSARNFETLFAQDRLWHVRGNGDVKACVLSDIPEPKVRVIDDHTIRLESDKVPFFTSFAGQMGTSQSTVRRVGDVAQAGEFEGRIVDAGEGRVRAVELRFRKPVKSDSYRFYWSNPDGPPHLAGDLGGAAPSH